LGDGAKRLGDVLHIDYSWHEIEVCAKGGMGGCLEAAGSWEPAINPDDIDVNDSVTFTWSLA